MRIDKAISAPIAGWWAALVLAWLFLFGESFSLGFMDEDFTWLLWSERSGWREIFSAPAASYFRPLSVRLPYWIFPRLPAGIFVWKLLAFTVTLGAAILFYQWLRSLSGRPRFAFIAASLWLLAPVQSFGLLYVNAFDYVLFPAVIIFFLWALERRRMGWACVALVLGLLTKELALVFPLVAMLSPARPRWRWLAAFWISAAAMFAWTKGLYAGEQGFAGFFLSELGEIPRRVFHSGQRIFWAGFVAPPRPGSSTWFLFANAILLSGFFALWRWGKAAERWRAFALALQLGLLLGPLFLLDSIGNQYLGGMAWVFFLALAAVGFRNAPSTPRAPRGVALASLALLFWYVAIAREELARPYRLASARYEALLQGAEPRLKACARGTAVVVEGLSEALETQANAEYGLWALWWRSPQLKFFLRQPPDFRVAEVIEPHRWMWVEDWRAAGHPHLRVRAGDPLEVEGKEVCAEDRHS